MTTEAVSRPRKRTPAKSAPRRAEATLTVDDDGVTTVIVPDEEEGSRPVEIAPKIPTPTVAERAREMGDKFAGLTSRVRSKKAPKVRGPRMSVDKLISGVWSIAARMVQPVAWPVANVLAVQAPVAGAVLEDIVKDTVVDTVLQPLARVGRGGEVVMALVGPPILVGLMSAKPETAPVAMPLLKESLRAWIDIAGPKMQEHAERERKFKEEYGESIDDMLKLFFTPPPGMVPDDGSSATGNPYA